MAQLAQRAYLQGGFLVGLSVLGLFVVTGMRRVRDLWSPIPRERADYWPGAGLDQAAAPDPTAYSPSSTVPTES